MRSVTRAARGDSDAKAARYEDVLRVIRAACRPLARKEVIRALRSAGTPHGAGTINKALADLTAAGELVNPRDRRGYRLKDWPRRPRTRSLF